MTAAADDVMTLRDIAQGIADCIAQDGVLHDDGHVTVVVEDKANVQFEIRNAIAQLGVAVLVAVTDFRRDDRSPFVEGMATLQLSCFEHPELNRDDISTLTAQGVAERLAQILHYRRFPFLAGQMIFKDFSRDDVDEANVVRGNYEARVSLVAGQESIRK